jgi:hypothetical protein
MRLPLHFLALILLSQQADIRLDVNLQEVRFSVQDGSGSAISTLASKDFLVEENGIRQDAVNVSHDTDTPVSFGRPRRQEWLVQRVARSDLLACR